MEREIEDLAAVIEHAGGTADLFGHSSGGCLALEAVLRGLPVRRLAVYEPPHIVDDMRPRPAPDLAQRLQALVAMDRRDDTAELFFSEALALPAEVIGGMRSDPATWSWFRELAPSLPHDAALFGPGSAIPAPERLAGVTVATLTLSGGASDPWLQAGAAAVAALVPGARHVSLDGQDHAILQQPAPLRPYCWSSSAEVNTSVGSTTSASCRTPPRHHNAAHPRDPARHRRCVEPDRRRHGP